MNDRKRVSLLDRIRRLWKQAPEQDYPLSEREREEHRPATGFDVRARVEQDFVGDDFDPDQQTSKD